jgi:5'-nucleotidase
LEDTPAVTVASAIEGLQFRREVDVVNAAVGELRDQNASAVVVVLHQGGFQDEKGTYDSCSGFRGDILPILQGQDGVPGLSTQVDVLVTGHTHQAYNCLLPREGAAPLLVTSAASYGRLLTKIDLLIDPKSKRVASKKAKNVAVTRDVTPDPEVLKIVEEYKEKAAPVANRIVGYLQGDLVADPATLASRSCETTMGDVIADAQLHATKSEGAQMAFMNPGGIRGDLIPRPDKSVTYSQVFGVQPFGNLLVTMDLLGSEIHTLLTQQFAGASPRILQVSSGFTYAHAFDPASGKVEISRLSLGGKPIEDARTYRVTVNSFLAAGADSFKVLEKGRRRVTGSIDVDALVAYLGTMSTASQPLATPKANRIQGNACAARP